MILTIDVSDPAAEWISSLSDADRRAINEATSQAFISALHFADANLGRSGFTAPPDESFDALVARLRALRSRETLARLDTAEVSSVIQEAAAAYNAGERGEPVDEAFASVRDLVSRR